MTALDQRLSASTADAPRSPGMGPDRSWEAGEPILDLQMLEELRALQARGKPDLLRRVVSLFMGHAPGLLVALQEALDRQDCTGLANAAHALKSSSGNLGAVRLTDLCARVEKLARSESLDGMRELLAAAAMEYAGAIAALVEYAGTP